MLGRPALATALTASVSRKTQRGTAGSPITILFIVNKGPNEHFPACTMHCGTENVLFNPHEDLEGRYFIIPTYKDSEARRGKII